jgi:uncharacterized membrane protein|tara:strand:- start:202 stop:885 length:684 start_codon:yes stop_codon:yes gene_type:complete
MKGVIIYISMFLLLVGIVCGATIHGTVYSFDLEEQKDSIVSVNSSPVQTIVAKDAEYIFDLVPGSYMISAYYKEDDRIKESSKDVINIDQEGTYILDFILFPSFDEEEFLMGKADEELIESSNYNLDYVAILVVVFVIAILIWSIFFILKHKKVVEKKQVNDLDEKDLAEEVLEFIKKENGRVTQKNIRKEFPQSEAKISLVISELEEKDVVKRIKKGRGNIIILKK